MRPVVKRYYDRVLGDAHVGRHVDQVAKDLPRLAGRYPLMLIDNEAGIKHLSRRLVQELDLLLIVSDPTLRGIETALRMSQGPAEMQTRVARKALLAPSRIARPHVPV